MIIALEGIDGSGKQTQARLIGELWRKYTDAYWPVHTGNEADDTRRDARVFSYPNYKSETGHKIRELLKGPDPDTLVLQSLMTVNRMEDTEDLWPFEGPLDHGLAVLDRYWWSGVAYGVFDGLDEQWLRRIHRGMSYPRLWVVLDIPVDVSFERRPVREDAYESNRKRLEHCREYYLKMAEEQGPVGALVVDGTQDPQDIANLVAEVLEFHTW